MKFLGMATLKLGNEAKLPYTRTEDENHMDYRRLIETVPPGKKEALLNKLVDIMLSSRSDDRMPSRLANRILHEWQQDTLISEFGLTALLEAAILLDPAKTVEGLTALELADVAGLVKDATMTT